ncbi:hypothetical protein A2763_00595 [Candidatus Kaiserbacteria bacterium RIFCSPHIGHO2_01_FULL_54_36]|uniref:Type II secretion system protein GspG C-terminal domain-containing protein n=1 Tax=Candidatus Kaiserbacteria bacterium RIFCSPHIGHO2_01_FULL_54_36 TaxID=1798482 RepID=A0A1F6CNP1_9BACT|nr:MAG: hypothetical protein A2763_00595 [Candidatus Kaiserbacteria bacterium RIFCSPHIGHO2_01_FULL_54_36]OGG75530.1 MAG: hypothetical protein A3A41_02800 [Candidatus Kaiserbacteria bacterium RIFCSPLOWO2_01_FULL_54_22]
MSNTTKEKGFTLIELLVVIAIIGLLSSVVLASLNNARKKGRDARRLADIKQLQLALELYSSDQAATGYPAALSSLVSTYIQAEPKDPSNSAWSYGYSGSATTYCLGARLETTPLPLSASCTPGSQCGGGNCNYLVAP